MRVIAGVAKGRRLVAPKGRVTRPTSDRARESVFGALRDLVVVRAVLDLYAGSGALAIEALSRGARSAVLVERDARATDAIRRNAEATAFTDHVRVVRAPVTSFVRGAPPAEAPFGLVFLDPPYEAPDDELGRVLGALDVPGWLEPAATVVVERAAAAGPPILPPGWLVTWRREYGDTLIVVVAARGAAEPSRSPEETA